MVPPAHRRGDSEDDFFEEVRVQLKPLGLEAGGRSERRFDASLAPLRRGELSAKLTEG